MSQDPALPKFEVPIADKSGVTTKNWYFFFSQLLNSITGGVTKIIAGTNVTISPISGVGDVTINATGGGGSGTVADITSTGGSITVTNPTGPTVNLEVTTPGGTGTVTSVATGTGLTGGPITTTGTLALANTAVTPGSYTFASITVDAQGRLTAASNGTVTGALPGTIPDLVFWMETDNILGASGAPVNRLQEKTPWITGVAAACPVASAAAKIDATKLNSLNVLTWIATGSTTGTYAMQPGFSLAGECTYFIVAKGLNNTKTGAQAICASTSTGTPALYLSNATGVQAIALVNEGVATLGVCSTTWTLGDFFQANVTYNATTGAWAFRQGRATANSGTGTTGVGATGNMTTLGNDQFGSTMGGSLAAVIVYNRVLSGTEIGNVEAYLLAKWGV